MYCTCNTGTFCHVYKVYLQMFRYVRFLNSRRTAVKGEHPNLPSSQITKIIGTEWNLMSVAEKQVQE